MDSASQADDQTLLIKSGFYTLLYFRQSISNLRLLHFFFVSFPNIFFHLCYYYYYFTLLPVFHFLLPSLVTCLLHVVIVLTTLLWL